MTLGILMIKTCLVFILLCLVLVTPVIAPALYGIDDYVRTSDWETICEGNKCVGTKYSYPVNILNESSGKFMPFPKVVAVSREGDTISFNHSHLYGATYRSYLVINGSLRTWHQISQNYPNLSIRLMVYKGNHHYKYSVNITNIPIEAQSDTKLQGIWFELISTHGLNADDVKKRDDSVIIKDEVLLSFDDLKNANFTIKTNKTGFLVGNLNVNVVNGSLLLDPAVILLGNRTGDVTVTVGGKGAQGTSNPFVVINISAGDYENLGVADDTWLAYNNGTSSFSVVQANFTLVGVTSSQIDSFNVSYVYGSAWDYSQVISGSVRDFVNDNWTDYDSFSTADANIRRLSINRTNDASNVFRDVGSNTQLSLSINESLSDANGIRVDYLSLTSVYTPQSIILSYSEPTPNDNQFRDKNWVFVNASVTNTTTIDTVLINWNGTNVTVDSKDLVLNMHFNNVTDNNFTLDSSRYNNSGQLFGFNQSNASTSGRLGNALTFDRNDDYVEVAASESLNQLTNNFSVMAWVNSKAGCDQTQGVVEKNVGGDVNTHFAMFIYSTGGTWFRVEKGGSLYTARSDSCPATNTWFHVTGVYNGAEVSVWVNGVKQGWVDNVSAPIDGGSGTLQIGRNPTTTYFFNGSIDDVRIWNRTLTPAEINASYQAEIGRYYANFTNLPDGNYTFYAWGNTTDGSSDVVNTRSLRIDSVTPTYTSFYNNGSVNNFVVNWTASLSDVTGVSYYVLFDNSSGSYVNNSFKNVGGTTINVSDVKSASGTGMICGAFWFNDSAGNVNVTNFSCTQIIDTNNPSVDFSFGSVAENATIRTNHAFFNFSWVESFNSTFIVVLSNGTNYSGATCNAVSCFFNVTGLGGGNWTVAGWINDTSGNSAITDNRSFVVDLVNPRIAFVLNTQSSGISITDSSVYVNVSANDSETDYSAFIDWNRSLVGYWRFEEGSGTNASDNSSYNNHGTLTNFGCTTLDCNASSGWVSNGKRGKAVTFDGINEYIVVPYSESLNVSTLTVSAWIKLIDQTSNWPDIVTRQDVFRTELQGGVQNTVAFSVLNTSRNVHTVGSGILSNGWHFITGTFDGSTVSLYIDGSLAQSGAVIGEINRTKDALLIGANGAGVENFNGSIDEAQVWNRALTAQEINASFSAGTYRLQNNYTGLTDGIYTYYAVAVDAAGNQNQTETRTLIRNLDKPTFTQNISLWFVVVGYEATLDINCSNTEYYWDNTTLFEINVSTGLINYTALAVNNGTFNVNMSCDDSLENESQRLEVVVQISNLSVALTSGIGSWEVLPNASNASGVHPTNQTNVTGVFNITNFNNVSWVIDWNFSITSDPQTRRMIDTFDDVGDWNVSNKTTSNSVWNVTRLCMDVQSSDVNVSEGTSSMRIRYSFNNTINITDPNNSSLNVTFVGSCQNLNSFFRVLNVSVDGNWSGYDAINFSYLGESNRNVTDTLIFSLEGRMSVANYVENATQSNLPLSGRDGNWSSYFSNYGAYNWNYSVPVGAQNGSLLQHKYQYGCGVVESPNPNITNYSLDVCFGANSTWLNFNTTPIGETDGVIIYCNNVQIVKHNFTGQSCVGSWYSDFYEEAVFFSGVGKSVTNFNSSELLLNLSSWQHVKLSFDADIDYENITAVRFYVKEFQESNHSLQEFFIDDLFVWNSTSNQSRYLTVKLGINSNYSNASTLSADYQNVFNLTALSSRMLWLWFDFNNPYLGLTYDFGFRGVPR